MRILLISASSYVSCANISYDDYKCKNCSKAYTDDCPKEKCWKNNYSEFIEENKE